MTDKQLTGSIRVVPDYPIKGIMFFDVTTLFKNPEAFDEVVNRICEAYRNKGITKVAGIESRGFIAGAAVAARLGAGFVPIRKPGKLPADTVSESYSKEYGTDTIEIHSDAITPDDVVLIHDDILATGGTASAAVRLVRKFSPKAVYANFIINITDCPRTSPIPSDVEVKAILELAEN
ncbi:MAG: adenine phosphoribosyltransferase [Bacteroidales bacterium]|nr:adenine phosphoribosyltransferase [Bacteroidales bacterium]MBQ9310742.1 adenine phosphoribosyltransferase [Bacteroidales bacterium]